MPGRHAQVDPRAGPRLDGGRRADHRRAVDAEHGGRRPGPHHVGDPAVAEQVDAVEHVRVVAELLRRVVAPGQVCVRVQPADGGVAVLVAQRGEHRDQRRQRVRGGAAEHARVHRARQRSDGDHDVGQAAQGGGEARHADREVAGVADQDRVRAQQVGVLRHERLEPAGALLLGALADDLHGDRQVVPERPQRGQVHRRCCPCSRRRRGRTSGRRSVSSQTGVSHAASSSGGCTSWWKYSSTVGAPGGPGLCPQTAWLPSGVS